MKLKKPKLDTIEDVLKRYSRTKGARANFESTYESVREIFAPYEERVQGEEAEGNELDFTKIFTDEPIEAVRVFVAGLQSYLTPANAPWISFRMRNQSLNKVGAVKEFLESIEKEVQYTLANSNFDTAIAEAFLQSVLYGTTTMLVDSDEFDRVRFTTLPVNAVYLCDNSKGQVNEFFISCKMTAEQAAERFGEKNLHAEMRKLLKEDAGYTQQFDFVYHIRDRKYRDKTKKDKLNMPISAQWIDVKNQHRCDESGFMEYPCATHRFYKRSTTPYGYSPCTLCLPSARTLNKMASTNLRGGMKYADPAIAVPSRGFLTKLNTNPNAINIYQKDVTKDSIFTLPGGQGVPFTIEMEQRIAERLKRMLYNDVFKALSNKTKEMTVPEVRQVIQESMTQMGPAIGRYQAEFLDKIIIRTVGILARGGYLPEPPAEIIQDNAYEIEYTSYLAQIQKQGSIRTVYDGLGVMQQLAAFDPAVLDNLDTDEAWRISADVIGLPASISRNEVEVAEIRQARAIDAAEQAKMQGLEQMTKSIGNVGKVAGAL